MSTYEFYVDMMCGGCERAVTAMVKKVAGVETVVATHGDKTLKITGSGELSIPDVENAIKKTGKAFEFRKQY